MSDNQRDSKKKVGALQLLSLGLFVVLMLMIFLRSNKPELLNVSSKAPLVDPDEVRKKRSQKVSKHLRQLEQKLEMERDRVHIENFRSAPAPRFRQVDQKIREHGVQMVQEKDSVLEDVRGKSVQRDVSTSPREYIYNELSMQSNEENEKILEGLELGKDQRTMIRQVLRNARKDGYELIINKNLVVVGYRKIDPFTGETSSEVVHLEPPKYGQ